MPIPTVRFVISTTSFSTLSVEGDVHLLLGFTPECFLEGHVSLQSRIHQGDHDLYQRLFEDKASSGSFPIRVRQANGFICIMRVDYVRKVGELFLSMRDVKDLFTYYENKPVDANMKAMLENSNDFIFFKNDSHVLTAASRTLAEICPPFQHWTELVGKTDYEIFPEKYADIYFQLEKQVYAGEKIANSIQGYVTTEGKEGLVDNRKYPIYGDDGLIIGLFGVARDVTERINLENKLKHQVQTDFLTGLSSRSYFLECVQKELNCNAREGIPFSILMMDIDLFKHINDTYGHQAGDRVLVKLADVCQKFFHAQELIGRLGGEEFSILLPNTSLENALPIAECLRETIAKTEVWVDGVSVPIKFTVSIGISTLLPISYSVDKLLYLADIALYEAKNSGRNRVCVYPSFYDSMEDIHRTKICPSA